ncbi:hypothetical protein GCM10009836_24020 [Pseudonocardia ailaonensis]|uniref:Uncharacterized protein n=1 Tax=Pseudonocardia ailaonensis TaxID=367279 RepID=A0ABN2N130_9PSEU
MVLIGGPEPLADGFDVPARVAARRPELRLDKPIGDPAMHCAEADAEFLGELAAGQ